MKNTTEPRILIYGATGYTGRLVSKLAAEQSLQVIISGRSEEKLSALGSELGLPYEVVSLADSAALDRLVQKCDVMLNLAGPYRETAAPIREACIRGRVHYVDITGELDVYEDHAGFHERARMAGITLLSGAGFDVVPSDCLAAYAKSRLEDTESLEMFFSGGAGMSQGTMRSGLGMIGGGVPLRENGKLIRKLVPATRTRDCGDGAQLFASAAWGDLITAWYSTGIQNIQVFFPAKKKPSNKLWLFIKAFLLNRALVQWFLSGVIRLLPDGPEDSARDKAMQYLMAEAQNFRGETFRARLTTPEAYTLTAHTALRSAREVAGKDIPRGYQTPATAFGADFILQFDGVRREDVPVENQQPPGRDGAAQTADAMRKASPKESTVS
ncbi:trans-acting enoyl reductase family protein [Microbulbifer sp. YPW1]|uniref:saccharopine dehydrogenase family protein n=1 Tax=Microbulbifer sp. YPW1 TaxID=2745199 RepID=UPI00159A0102|nr:saccharopine dehydrogenase NADP-binding domain-containing protein [Microbulbifer sp. YPW1]QKX17193.1 saccharopine dehydrogenase NADP-binding domain-containing protein [Microbulbifer sp. YPW1]